MSKHGVEYLYNVSTWKDVKKFVFDNKESLEYLKQYEGLDNFLGSGQYGKVFKIKGEELVLKVTTDPYELKVSEKIKGHKLNTFIEVYFVKSLKSGHGIKIQELLYPLNSSQEKFVEKVFDIQFFEIGKLDKGQNVSYENIINLLKNYQKKAEAVFLLRVVEDVKKIGLSAEEFLMLDLNPGNFLKDRQGNLKICDL